MLLLRFAVHIQFRIVAIVVYIRSRDTKPTIHFCNSYLGFQQAKNLQITLLELRKSYGISRLPQQSDDMVNT